MSHSTQNNQFKRPAASAGGRPEATALGEANQSLIAELQAERDRAVSQNAELTDQLREQQKQMNAGQMQAVAAAGQAQQVLDQNKLIMEQNTLLATSLREATASAAGIGAAAGQLAQAGGQQPGAIVPPHQVTDAVETARRVMEQNLRTMALEADKHAAIKHIIAEHTKQMKSAQKEINEARGARAKLAELTIDCENPATPLPQHSPKTVRACHEPKLYLPREMGKDEASATRLAGYQKEVDQKVRQLQKKIVEMTIEVKKDIIAFYTAKRVEDTAKAALEADVTAFLNDTDISAATKRRLTEGAVAKFVATRDEEITKIELAKKSLADTRAEKERVEEDARLQLLTETDGSTVASVVRELIAEDKRATAAEDEVEMDLGELQRQNAEIQLQLQNHPDFPGVAQTQKGKKGKGKGKESKGKGKPTHPPAAKGKGQSQKGKGTKRPAPTGGGTKAGSTAAKGKGRGKGKSKKGGTRGGK